jgi:hypothetical protein
MLISKTDGKVGADRLLLGMAAGMHNEAKVGRLILCTG